MIFYLMIFVLLPPSWEWTGNIQGATSIYSIVEAQDGSIICVKKGFARKS